MCGILSEGSARLSHRVAICRAGGLGGSPTAIGSCIVSLAARDYISSSRSLHVGVTMQHSVGIGSLLIAFLLGSVPFGLILTRTAGLGDIRAIGSGSIGATNVLRTGRKDLAAATMLLDLLKGTAAVLLARYLGGPAALAGFAAVLGHTLTPWLRFHGGKGVATAAGALFGMAWFLGGATCLIWLAAAATLRISSAAALFACAAAPLLALMVHPYPWPILLMSAWIVWRHRSNIARLRTGTEPRIGAR